MNTPTTTQTDHAAPTDHTDQQAQLTKLMEQFKPEFIQLRDIALKDRLTQNGYGIVLQFITPMSRVQQQFFLLGLVSVGYPQVTARQIASILRIN